MKGENSIFYNLSVHIVRFISWIFNNKKIKIEKQRYLYLIDKSTVYKNDLILINIPC